MSARRFRHLWLSLLVAALTATPLAKAQSAPLDPARPAAGRDVVVVANDSFLNQAPASLLPDPLLGESWVVDFTRTQTAKRDSAWKLFPEGVESLPSVKEGIWKVEGERMTLVWRLRPRNWHDGRPGDERVVDAIGPTTRRVAHVTCPNGETGREMIVTWRERFAWVNLYPPWPLPRHLLERYLRLVGIEVTVVNFPFRQFFGVIMQRRQFKGLALYAYSLTPTDGCERYTSGRIPSEANGWRGNNFPGYENSEIDRLCPAIPRELDEIQRTSTLRRAAQILARDLPVLTLYNRPYAVAAKAGLENFKLGWPCAVCNLLTATWNAHQWAWR